MKPDKVTLGSRMPEEEARLIRAWAMVTGRSVSTLIRETVVATARERLGQVGAGGMFSVTSNPKAAEARSDDP